MIVRTWADRTVFKVCDVVAELELLASENTVIGQFCEDWQHAKNNFRQKPGQFSA